MTPRIIAVIALVQTLAGCATRDDDYMLLRRGPGEPKPGEPVRLTFAPPNDADAWYVRHLLADGFGAEMLRTYAMTKRFAARTSEYRDTPTYLAIGDRATGDHKRQVEMRLWRSTLPDDAPVIWLDSHSPAAMTNLVTALADATVDVVAPHSSGPLRAGYVEFIQVVAAEWRPPRAIDDRDELRRLPGYARVRGNYAVSFGSRPARELASDPEVIATVLYRMAASELGQTMAPAATYHPFLASRAPRDVHPALLLGAFRNFQAKLLAAWSGAVRAHRPLLDVVDLVEAYAAAHPAERAEATRILLVTTYGATVVPAGVALYEQPAVIEAKLATLTADVLFGRRGLHDAFGR